MNSSKLASGDNDVSLATSPRHEEDVHANIFDNTILPNENDEGGDNIARDENITPQMIDDNELKLKERITQCKNIIESLKLQLSEEKSKLMTERKAKNLGETPQHVAGYYNATPQGAGNTSMYSACVEKKLYCDESLIEYEMQLQKYQNTLNMAQNEKKNAIRKQMLAKAFKLKLMEVENQCNIELIRVKQSLQCLEPLQMIASKWNNSTIDDSKFDINSYELMPSFLELKAYSGTDVNNYKEEPCVYAKEESARSE